MPSSALRDDAVLVAGLDRWLRHHDRAPLAAIERPSTGWSNETLVATLTDGERVVVRMPPIVASYPDPVLETEAEVLAVLPGAGVAAPRLVAREPDASWLDAPFVVMSYVGGRTAGEAPSIDPWIADAPAAAQRRMLDGFLDALGALHTFDVERAPLAGRLRRGLRAELEYWRSYVDWASAPGTPARALVDAFEWCAANAPHHEPSPSLLWGDARLGNVRYDDTRAVVALLDWELASIGPAEMDVAWYLLLDDLTSKIVGRRVEAFPSRDEFVARHERTIGRPLEHLAWHEVFALARSIAVNDRQARIARSAGVDYPGLAGDDNPMLGVLRRRIDRYERG